MHFDIDCYNPLDSAPTIPDSDRQWPLSIQLVPTRHDLALRLPLSAGERPAGRRGFLGVTVVQADGTVLESGGFRVSVRQVYLGGRG